MKRMEQVKRAFRQNAAGSPWLHLVSVASAEAEEEAAQTMCLLLHHITGLLTIGFVARRCTAELCWLVASDAKSLYSWQSVLLLGLTVSSSNACDKAWQQSMLTL